MTNIICNRLHMKTHIVAGCYVHSLPARPAKVPRGLAHIDPWDTLSGLVVRVNGLNPGMVSEQESAVCANMRCCMLLELVCDSA